MIMIKVNKPTNLDGVELRAELRAAGVDITDGRNAVFIDDNGILYLEIAAKDKAKADEVIAKHNGKQTAPELSIAEKLASIGLTIDDLKTALAL
jgi:hypothetical protein